jgi:hypothetical protein
MLREQLDTRGLRSTGPMFAIDQPSDRGVGIAIVMFRRMHFLNHIHDSVVSCLHS